MKIAAISDTHEQHRALKNMPVCDVLVHAGDMTYKGDFEKVYDIAEWFKRQLKYGTCKHVVCIPGNHDLTAEKQWDRFKAFFDHENIHLLNGSGAEIDGVKFWGSPFTPAFGGGWAFQLERNGKDAEEHWAKLPEGTDVVVTHGPPNGYRDKVQDMYSWPVHNANTGKIYYNTVSVGCAVLRERLKVVKPKAHVCGHIHPGYGQVRASWGTRIVNASSCNERYSPVNPPIVFDV